VEKTERKLRIKVSHDADNIGIHSLENGGSPLTPVPRPFNSVRDMFELAKHECRTGRAQVCSRYVHLRR